MTVLRVVTKVDGRITGDTTLGEVLRLLRRPCSDCGMDDLPLTGGRCWVCSDLREIRRRRPPPNPGRRSRS